MKFTIKREILLEPLQLVCGAVEKRQTLPVLGNLLLVVEDDQLTLTGTDQEVELTARIDGIAGAEPGEITVPARKLLDICRSLPDGAEMTAQLEGNRLALDSGRFSSHLATLPATEFPDIDDSKYDVSINLNVDDVSRLLSRTSFAMAQQDVRYFFNGVLIEAKEKIVRFVATNGQRLASSYVSSDQNLGDRQFIVPRKGIGELVRILGDGNSSQVALNFSENHMKVERGNIRLVTKLIDATYPDYTRAIPVGGDKIILADRVLLKEALSRTAILSNELYRNVRLKILPGKLEMHANNPQHEEAEETVSIEYEGPEMEVGFNVSYLIETLSVMPGATVRLTLSDSVSACLLEDLQENESLFVISPMVL